jgi:uncharacterized protein YjiS (DUF1127 family)
MRNANRQSPLDSKPIRDKKIFPFPGHVRGLRDRRATLAVDLVRLAASLRRRRRGRYEAIRRLLALDDRMLADIGLSPRELRDIVESWRSGRWQPDRWPRRQLRAR